MTALIGVLPVGILVALLFDTQWSVSLSFVFTVGGGVSIVLLSLHRTVAFAMLSGALGLGAGMSLAILTSWGIAPPVACALSGLGAALLVAPVVRMRIAIADSAGYDEDEDGVAMRAIDGAVFSILALIGTLTAATLVVSLLALNLDLGSIDVGELVILAAIAIVMATVLVLVIQPEAEKNVK